MKASPDLFGWSPPPSEQDIQLARVFGKIGRAVMAFIRRVDINGEFHAQELHEFVGDQVAPASADRILRQLRLTGAIDYVVVNRRASLYRVLSLSEECHEVVSERGL